MRKFSPALFLFLFVLNVGLPAKEATPAKYLNPAEINLKALLPDPPANGSPETQKEIELILQKQETRTPEEVARIKRELPLDAFVFEDVLGPWFQEKDLPATAALMKNVKDSDHDIVMSAKAFWARPRPPLQDARVHPPVDLPPSGAYPSGHATLGLLQALVLAQLAPDLKDQLVERGRLIGSDRVIAGVHFPSDVVAGQKLAQFLFDRMSASPAFRADLAKAKVEFDAARRKH